MPEILKELYRAAGIGFGVYEMLYEPFNYNGQVKYTIKDLIHIPEDHVKVNPQREFVFCPPGTAARNGVPFFPKERYIHVRYGSADPYGDGLLKHAYIPYWYKRNSALFCMQYFERFGNPPMIGFHKSGNEQDKETVLEMLENLRSSSVASLPESDKPPMPLEPGRDAGFSWWLTFLNDEESKVFMFGTRTMSPSDASGAKSATDTHSDAADDRSFSIHRKGMRIITRQMIKHLININFGPQEVYPYAVPGSKDIDDSNEYLDKLTKVSGAGVQVDISMTEFYEKSGISKPNPTLADDILTIGKSAPAPMGGLLGNFQEGVSSQNLPISLQSNKRSSNAQPGKSTATLRARLTNWQKRMGWM
jgi:phage gp29-like protein